MKHEGCVSIPQYAIDTFQVATTNQTSVAHTVSSNIYEHVAVYHALPIYCKNTGYSHNKYDR